MNALRKIYNFLTKDVWERDISELRGHERYLAAAWKFIYIIYREHSDFQLSLRAMGLVYTTLLSIVPLLAVSFSVLQAFGVHNEIRPFLSRFLAPLGPQGAVITNNIIQYIGRMNISVLGSIGLALLIYSIIGVIYKIEEALNYIWRVKRPRSFRRRFTEYLSILFVGPILMFSAIGLTAAIKSNTLVRKVLSIGPLGNAYVFLAGLIPYITVCAVFTLLYLLMPNTKVKLTSALAGGVFAGVGWEVLGWAFATYTVSSKSYSAIYAGFAIVILFMIWLNLSWQIFLVGGAVSFYIQHPRQATLSRAANPISGRYRERLAVLIMYLIGYNFYFGRPPWTLDRLAEHLRLPPDAVRDSVEMFEKEKLIYESGEEGNYLPGRDIETIKVKEVVSLARTAGEAGAHFPAGRLKEIFPPEINAVMKGIEEKIGEALNDTTIRDLVMGDKELKKAA